jgi:regulatory protein
MTAHPDPPDPADRPVDAPPADPPADGTSPDGGSPGPAGRGARGRRPPKPATPARLEKAALWYLERWSATADSLRRVLLRRVRRSAEIHGTDPDEGAAAVEAIVAKCRQAGLVDDAAFARARSRTLARRGASPRLIRARLAAKGVDDATADAALADLAEETDGDPGLAAAVALARRRRLGPFARDPASRADRRDRDLAALARAGFDLDTARTVIDAESAYALEAEAGRLP